MLYNDLEQLLANDLVGGEANKGQGIGFLAQLILRAILIINLVGGDANKGQGFIILRMDFSTDD